ncbi:MAG: hypothetical protein K0B08_00705 [Bacteroidales bacterium]|nr:hypothetical protein [Bacteroidales bacterium]
MKPTKNLAKSIKANISDIKAEVIMADLADRGMDADKMLVACKGLFRRNYEKDVANVQFDQVIDYLVFQLSRDGLYDLLPEGLFHEMCIFSSLGSEERRKQFARQKQEEANARKFFLPYENEFLQQRVRIEQEIIRLHKDPLGAFKSLFSRKSIFPDDYHRRFLKFYAFSGEIKGNIELTAAALSEILEKEVVARSYYSDLRIDCPDDKGSNILGENFISSEGFIENQLYWEFTIVIDENAEIDRYAAMDKGFIQALVTRFYDTYVPFEIETVTKFDCRAAQPFMLGERSSLPAGSLQDQLQECYLGYNVTL